MMKNMNTRSRRSFLKTLAGGSAAALSGLPLAMLPRGVNAMAPGFGDYKALVCVMLLGGNDAHNMLIPTSPTDYADYVAGRGDMGVALNPLAKSGLNDGTMGNGSNNPYRVGIGDSLTSAEEAYLNGYYDIGHDLGVNAVMPELAQLLDDNKASIIANCGALVEPGATRATVANASAKLPLFLFAHNHQQRIIYTGQSDNLRSAGWAGRIADNWTGINGGSLLGLNVSYFGNLRLMIGDETSPLYLQGTPGSYKRFLGHDQNPLQEDRRALFQALTGLSGRATPRLDFGPERVYAPGDPFKSLYNRLSTTSLESSENLVQTWAENDPVYTSTDPYGQPLFSVPTANDLGFHSGIKGNLIGQLNNVAKMIYLSKNSKFPSTFNRQIFLVAMGGFDTHSDQLGQHPSLLRELSLGLWSFQKAMEDLGLNNNVMSFTMSDFGRTLQRNGDGTDHAWAGHHLVMGGDGSGAAGTLNGGQMFGRVPSYKMGKDDDMEASGRFIPDIGQDQINASLCNWFGVDEALMPTIFPNITKFQSGNSLDTAYLPLFG